MYMAEAKPTEEPKSDTYGDDYEILPHKDIVELREELKRLRAKPTERTLQISMVELAGKVDRLIDIFQEAMESIRVEEGGLTFQEKMKPLLTRMDKVLEQNSQIAEGIVALADMVNEVKGAVPELPTGPEPIGPIPPAVGPAPIGVPPVLPGGPAPLPPAKPLPSVPAPPKP